MNKNFPMIVAVFSLGLAVGAHASNVTNGEPIIPIVPNMAGNAELPTTVDIQADLSAVNGLPVVPGLQASSISQIPSVAAIPQDAMSQASIPSANNGSSEKSIDAIQNLATAKPENFSQKAAENYDHGTSAGQEPAVSASGNNKTAGEGTPPKKAPEALNNILKRIEESTRHHGYNETQRFLIPGVSSIHVTSWENMLRGHTLYINGLEAGQFRGLVDQAVAFRDMINKVGPKDIILVVRYFGSGVVYIDKLELAQSVSAVENSNTADEGKTQKAPETMNEILKGIEESHRRLRYGETQSFLVPGVSNIHVTGWENMLRGHTLYINGLEVGQFRGLVDQAVAFRDMINKVGPKDIILVLRSFGSGVVYIDKMELAQ